MTIEIRRYYADEDYVAEYEPTNEEMEECIIYLLSREYRNLTPIDAFVDITDTYTIVYEEQKIETFEDVVKVLDLTQNDEFLEDYKEDIEEYFDRRF